MIGRYAIMLASRTVMYHYHYHYHYRDAIPARRPLIAVSAAAVLWSGLLPNYRLAVALPLAYVVELF